ncbi:MAG: NAD(P)/FAD-dependent oxidoreductase [Deltaproteobacteria bacterium]|nr:NAD(P)/FAD-dependent oxidoreductase [Deltaproteobacteria bacterium]
MADYDAIIIGAGLGGLSSGALLAHQGLKVLVLEQSDRIGGCCSTFERNGYKHDVGASIVEIIQPIEKVFELLGTKFQDEVDLIPCDPLFSVMYRNGERITIEKSLEATGEVISSLSAEDGRHWKDFCDYFQEMMDVLIDALFFVPADTFGDMANMIKKNPKLLKFLPTFLVTYQDLFQKYFKSNKVLDTMAYQSLYMGMPPALTPGPFAMIPFTEHSGIWYPRGGMIKIPEALLRCGQKDGLEIRMKAGVKKVVVKGGRSQGVVLEDGGEITSRIVVSNVNPQRLYLELIGEEHLPWLTKRGVKSLVLGKSLCMIYVGLDSKPDLDAHHSYTAVSMQEVNDFWTNHVETGIMLPAEKNYGLICWTSHSDDSLAPKGHHVINVIPESFYHLKGTNWDAYKDQFVDDYLDYVSRDLVPDLKGQITQVIASSPMDYERNLRLPEGSLYAFNQDATHQAVFRPSAKSKCIDGLYLSGSGTHPGGGVPTTIASGMIAYNKILQNEKV